MNRISKLLANTFKLATSDLANQYALPVSSMTGHVLTRYAAAKSKVLNQKVIEHMNIRPEDYIFEIGYGRGDAIKMCLEKLSGGNGMIFGVERSGFMDETVRKRFDLEIAESGQVRIDSALDLRDLPYPTDLFNHVFHVDVFYFLPENHLLDINREILRVLKPGAEIFVGMQFSRLKKLTEHNLLDASQWDPIRYLSALEAAQFTDVKIHYHQDEQLGEYQIISARKPERELTDEDPDEIMKKLAAEMKQERLAAEMFKTNSKISSTEDNTK